MKTKRYSVFLLIHLWIGVFCFQVWAQDTLSTSGEQKSAIQSKEEILRNAENFYASGNYRKSIELYESLLQEYGESSNVYYNLGNAYYKLNTIAPAILNYERALLLSPGDGDIRFNLELAKLKTTDKIESLDDFFLSKWIKGLQNLCSTNQWSRIAIISFFILIVGLVLFFFSTKVLWKKIGFYVAVVCLVFTIASNIFAYQQKKKLTNRNSAIVFAPTITIKSSPDQSGTDIVVLHEGTKVLVRSKLGNWSEIILEDGNIGWIESKMIEII